MVQTIIIMTGCGVSASHVSLEIEMETFLRLHGNPYFLYILLLVTYTIPNWVLRHTKVQSRTCVHAPQY